VCARSPLPEQQTAANLEAFGWAAARHPSEGREAIGYEVSLKGTVAAEGARSPSCRRQPRRLEAFGVRAVGDG
jgi:hypothetical protein